MAGLTVMNCFFAIEFILGSCLSSQGLKKGNTKELYGMIYMYVWVFVCMLIVFD